MMKYVTMHKYMYMRHSQNMLINPLIGICNVPYHRVFHNGKEDLTCRTPVWLKTAFAVLVQEGGGIGARLVRGKGK